MNAIRWIVFVAMMIGWILATSACLWGGAYLWKIEERLLSVFVYAIGGVFILALVSMVVAKVEGRI